MGGAIWASVHRPGGGERIDRRREVAFDATDRGAVLAAAADDLAVALRTAGVASIAEVACAVLEPTGAISVTRWDPARPLDPALFAGVVGMERVPADRFRV